MILMAGVGSVTAHHSGTMFDGSKTETVTGTVKELRWVNPHVHAGGGERRGEATLTAARA